MKKLFTLIISAFTLYICTSCSCVNAADDNIYQNYLNVHRKSTQSYRDRSEFCNISLFKIDGHDYIIIRDRMHGGITMCHSESCICNK